MSKNVKLFCVLAAVVVFITVASVAIFNREDIIIKDNKDKVLTEETVNLLIIEPDYFNPLVSKNKYVQEIANLVFDGLTNM